jgi:dihydroorotate dehydrogenase (fumarate)
MVKALEQAGVAGVSLFNRFYQPDINLDTLQLQHSLHPSHSADALLAMRWVAILRDRVSCSLGATGGVHTSADVLKLLLAGADVVHLCTALLQRGPQYLAEILTQLRAWMQEHGFAAVGELRGRMSQTNVQDPAEFERLNYIHLLDSYSLRADP